MKKSALLVYNHSLSSPKYQAQVALFQAAAQDCQMDLQGISNQELRPSVQNSAFSLSIQPKDYDFCLFLDKDVLLAEQIQAMGLPVYNSPSSIALCDNKIAMTQALCLKNVPVLDSFFSTIQFLPPNQEDFLASMAKSLGFPLVVKEAYGSFGEQVYLAKCWEELITISNKIGTKSCMYQRYLASSKGKDLRLYVVGNQVVGAMKRENQQDFRANLSIGGKISPYSPTKAEINLAISANHAMGTFFSGVDLLWQEDGSPMICEVNASPHIKHYFDHFGENIALPLVKQLVKQENLPY